MKLCIKKIEELKTTIDSVVPDHDSRAKISPISFILSLIFSFSGDTKKNSLESIRLKLIDTVGEKISRSSFWDRLARQRTVTHLKETVFALLKNSTAILLGSPELLTGLGVSQILILDSTVFSLWDGLSDTFKGTRTTASTKWHACFDALTGENVWSKTTKGSASDVTCFPDIELLSGKLILFDLGYFDFTIFAAISSIGGFFLSRLKSSTNIVIDKCVAGLGKRHEGGNLKDIVFKRKHGEIIELLTTITRDSISNEYRVIGFWNTDEKKYHWYITNLLVSANIMYTLYRFRWQIELIFKGCKQSFNANRLATSNNQNIVEALLYATIAAQIVVTEFISIGIRELDLDQQNAVSFQRIAKVGALLRMTILHTLLYQEEGYIEYYLTRLKLFLHELYDPNYKKRKTTRGKLYEEVGKLLK